MKHLIIMSIAALCLGVVACSSSKSESNAENSVMSFFSSGNTITASKNYVSKTVSVKNFDTIRSVGSFSIEYKHGNSPRIELYMPDNVLPYISYEVSNKELKISAKPNTSIRWGNNSKAKITVYSPSVTDFTLIGSGDLIAKETLSGEDAYKFQLTGSGDLDIRQVKAANSIEANLAGSGDLNILDMETNGNKGIKLSLSGSGDLNVNKLKANSASISLAGSGDLNVASINTVTTSASLAGSGDMRLRGTTTTASYSLSGSGDLSAGQLRAKDVNASATGSGEITCYATGKTSFQSIHRSSIRNVAR